MEYKIIANPVAGRGRSMMLVRQVRSMSLALTLPQMYRAPERNIPPSAGIAPAS